MLAIIPARGGSKGIPGKNIRLLHEKPLIAYTIEAAKNARCISDVYVTTDSLEIAEVSRKYGAQVPFLRPASLASDNASAVDVYLHAVDFINKNSINIIQKFIVLLPTAPLRNAKDIDTAYNLFVEKKATTLISVKEAETPLSWYVNVDRGGYLKNITLDDNTNMLNRQVNHKYFVPNGAIYILDFETLKRERSYYTDNTVAYVMPRERSIDIDDPLDFEIASFLYKRLKDEAYGGE